MRVFSYIQPVNPPEDMTPQAVLVTEDDIHKDYTFKCDKGFDQPYHEYLIDWITTNWAVEVDPKCHVKLADCKKDLELALQALKTIATPGYGLDINDSLDVRCDHWHRIVERDRMLANAILIATGYTNDMPTNDDTFASVREHAKRELGDLRTELATFHQLIEGAVKPEEGGSHLDALRSLIKERDFLRKEAETDEALLAAASQLAVFGNEIVSRDDTIAELRERAERAEAALAAAAISDKLHGELLALRDELLRLSTPHPDRWGWNTRDRSCHDGMSTAYRYAADLLNNVLVADDWLNQPLTDAEIESVKAGEQEVREGKWISLDDLRAEIKDTYLTEWLGNYQRGELTQQIIADAVAELVKRELAREQQ